MVESILNEEMDSQKPTFWAKLWPSIITGVITITLSAVGIITASSYANGGRDAKITSLESRTDKLENNKIDERRIERIESDVRDVRNYILDGKRPTPTPENR